MTVHAEPAIIEQLDALAAAYGNRFLLEPAPDHRLPDHGMVEGDLARRPAVVDVDASEPQHEGLDPIGGRKPVAQSGFEAQAPRRTPVPSGCR